MLTTCEAACIFQHMSVQNASDLLSVACTRVGQTLPQHMFVAATSDSVKLEMASKALARPRAHYNILAE